MKTHKISVTVDQSSIKVTPDPLVMTRADEVHWAGQNARKFSIEFDGASPFGSRQLKHAEATSKQKPGSKGRFKYSVVSEENPSLRLDPEIIIEDPPTSPNP